MTERRKRSLDKLYINNYSMILDMALADSRLMIADGHSIAQSVTKHLDLYRGPLKDKPFQKWAASIVKPAVSRIVQFYELRDKYQKSVLAGIWVVLKNAKDLAGDDIRRIAQELAHETWCWVSKHEHLDSILTPGTATVSTRLYARAYWTARAWKTNRLRERQKIADIDVDLLGKNDYDEDGILYLEPDWTHEEIA